MASAARVHAVENGKDTAERTLIAFGGAAPLHAARLARKLGMKRVMVPVGAGVGSAFGFLRAPIAYEVVRTRHLRLDLFDAKTVNGLFAAMRAGGRGRRAPGGARRDAGRDPPGLHALSRPGSRDRGRPAQYGLRSRCRARSAQRFEATYVTVFGRIIPKLEVEALTWTLSLATARPLPKPAPPAQAVNAPEPSSHREVIDPARAGTPRPRSMSALRSGPACRSTDRR